MSISTRWSLLLLLFTLPGTCVFAQEAPSFQMIADSFARYVAELPNDEARLNAYARMIRWKVREDSAFTFMALDRMEQLVERQATNQKRFGLVVVALGHYSRSPQGR
ncbi:MAG: hypothetical protein AAGA62_12625, partial [Bacteroidota bacterium]